MSRIGDQIRKLTGRKRDRFTASGVPGESRWFEMLDRTNDRPLADRPFPLSVYFNRHKCASRYVLKVLTEYLEPLSVEMLPRVTWGYDLLETDWALRHIPRSTRLITAGPCSNQVYDLLVKNEAVFNGFHVFRDPRDMVVSGYFSHLNSHPVRWIHQKHHFQRIQNVSLEEGIRYEIDYLGFLELDALRTWDLNDQRVRNVKFEDLTANPLEEFSSIFSFLGLPLHPERLADVFEQVNFKTLSEGRNVGEEDTSSHYRSGKSGDWGKYLSGENYRYFLDRYGDVLERLGYSADS